MTGIDETAAARDEAQRALDMAAHASDPRDPANGAGAYAIAAALMFVGDELAGIRQSIDGVTRTGGVSLADAVAGAVDHATTEVANAARSIAQHGGGWDR